MAGGRILIVNDDHGPAEITARLLAAAGFSVERADSVDDALVKLSLADPPFDLVLVDFADGVTPGVKLLDRIRDNDALELANVRVVIATDSPTNRLFAWQSGVDEFLVRPYRAEEFVSALKRTLERDDEERAVYRREQVERLRSQ
ncbi:MAG: hypothetical protein KatS3mg008_1454 [Acidimicrobiales bacterium]|nr:MAG: hypothetical protein KatS3mg008_1454 [Acidimicrobiales bacterium]